MEGEKDILQRADIPEVLPAFSGKGARDRSGGAAVDQPGKRRVEHGQAAVGMGGRTGGMLTIHSFCLHLAFV